MGFTCFSCKKPFEEDNPEEGAGDRITEKSVSATRCGHLFHSECLKRHFELQSQNAAWVAKSCPVCRTSLAIQDIIRVHACPYDELASGRPVVQNLLEQNKQLQLDKSELFKRVEMLFIQNRSVENDLDAIKQENENLMCRNQQLTSFNSRQKSELDRYQVECDKLKDIIITLTARLTGSLQSDLGGMSLNHGRLSSYIDDRQGFSAFDTPLCMNNNGLELKHAAHPPPPGLPFPLIHPVENGSDTPGQNTSSCSSIEEPYRSTSSNSNGNLLQMRSDLPTNFLDMGISTLHGKPAVKQNCSQINVSLPENKVYNSVNGDVAIGMNWRGVGEVMQVKSTHAIVLSKEDASDENAKENRRAISTSATEKSELQKSGAVQIKELKFSEEEASSTKPRIVEIDLETDSSCNGKWQWHEKKSRRRTTSKGRNTPTPSAAKTTSNPQLASDRKLYSSFHCTTCNAKWGSSQSYLNKSQTCRYCETEVKPHAQGPILSRRQLEMSGLAEITTKSGARK